MNSWRPAAIGEDAQSLLPGNFCRPMCRIGSLGLRYRFALAAAYPYGYTAAMNTFLRTDEFDAWLAGLKDNVARARIIHRIRSAEHGNFGDCEPVGEGVSEMRIHVGPGYRAYYTRRGAVIYLLLLGGDKSSQKRDIKRAIEMARTLDKE